MTKATAGTWLARAYGDAGYAYETLGDFGTLPESERYDAARKAAEAWFQHLDMGGATEPCSVKAACLAYLEKIRTDKSERAALETEGYFKRLVYGDPIAKVLLSKLSKPQMAGWRERALEHNGDRSSFNRNITPLRAALNLAREQGKVATDQAWLVALQPFKDDELEEQCERRRTLVLDHEERVRLVSCASDEARPLFKTWALLPLRPGDAANLKPSHIDSLKDRKTGTVHYFLNIPKGKTRKRIVPLSHEVLTHFKECAKGKLPGAWLISRADGSQWKKEQWKKEVKAAARKARLPRATVAYTFRHSAITEMILGGKDIFTVAKISGTSVRMIEKHYGHLRSDHAMDALEMLSLKIA
jgi:integrase